MFNLLDTTEGDKVDFWILTDDPFDQSRFARKYEEKMLGLSMIISTPEDTILKYPNSTNHSKNLQYVKKLYS